MISEDLFAKNNERLDKITKGTSNISSTDLVYQQKIEEKDIEINKLNEINRILKEQVSDLTLDNVDLKYTNKGLEIYISDFKHKKKLLLHQKDQLKDKILDLEHQNTDLESQLSDLNAENGKLSNSMGEYKEILNTSQLRKKEDDLEFNQLLKDYKELEDLVYWKTEDIKKYRITLVVLNIIIIILLVI